MSHLTLQLGSALIVPFTAARWRHRSLCEAVLGRSAPLLAATPCDRDLLRRVVVCARPDSQRRPTRHWQSSQRIGAPQ